MHPPDEERIIKGWDRDDQTVDSFLVTEYAKSAAAILKRENSLGTITAVFSAAWPVDKPPPADEPPTRRSFGPADATGFGAPKEMKVQPVQRQTGVVRASASVRYARPAERN